MMSRPGHQTKNQLVRYFEKDGHVDWLVASDGSVVVVLMGLKSPDIHKPYPTSPEAEAAGVHTPLDSPMIVDGVRYVGNQISLFNGHRLYFAIGMDGNLYAFTTAKGFEKFQKEYSTSFNDFSMLAC